MAKPKKDNRVKRKRGKSFKYHSDDIKQASEAEAKAKELTNPFENHGKSKRAKRDADNRVELVQEFQNRNKNTSFTDSRLGETSSRLTEEDKMKLRFMKL